MSNPNNVNKPNWIQLKPGVPWAPPAQLNRLARQQGLCLAIAQASVYDEICQATALPKRIEQEAMRRFRQQEDLDSEVERKAYLKAKGWTAADLRYFATKGLRLERFQQLVFQGEVELRFLANKLDLDQISYSLIRVTDSDLAFELHQRLLEGEASFEELASAYSEGKERDKGGSIGPVPLNQAHDAVVNKLRVAQPGQLWPPFFLEDIWLILRLDQWQGARLDDDTRAELLDELLNEWIQNRVMQLLDGETPAPLPMHLLEAG
jgi:hypothetical protein